MKNNDIGKQLKFVQTLGMSMAVLSMTFSAATAAHTKSHSAQKTDTVVFKFPNLALAWVDYTVKTSGPSEMAAYKREKIVAQSDFVLPRSEPLNVELKPDGLSHPDDLDKLKVCNVASFDAAKLDAQSKQLYYLGDYKHLSFINLHSTSVDDQVFVPLSHLSELAVLRVSHTYVTGSGIQNLNKCPKLVDLRASNLNLKPDSVVKIKPLLARTICVDFGRDNLSVADVQALHVAKKMQSLDISYNTVVSDRTIKAIEGMNVLHDVHLEGTAVTNKSVDFLASLPALQSVYISPATFWRTSKPIKSKGHVKFVDISSAEDEMLEMFSPLH